MENPTELHPMVEPQTQLALAANDQDRRQSQQPFEGEDRRKPQPPADAARPALHLALAFPDRAAQARVIAHPWPRAQRTLRELMRDPKKRRPRAYGPIDRPHVKPPAKG